MTGITYQASPGGAGNVSALGGLNPVSKLAMIAVITVALLLTLDPLVIGCVLVLELLAVPFMGLGVRAVAVRVGVLALVSAFLLLVNALFGGASTVDPFVSWGPFALSAGGLTAAAPVGMRMLALSMPAALLLAPTDPVELSDAVERFLRVPTRYVMATLVGLRLLPLLVDHWGELSAARRARGISARGPVSAARGAFGRTVGLLIEALRRGIRIASAMQARGFDPYGERTRARTSALGTGDLVAVALTTLVVAGLSAYGRLR